MLGLIRKSGRRTTLGAAVLLAVLFSSSCTEAELNALAALATTNTTIVDGQVAVSATSYESYPVVVTSTRGNARLKGDFTASGGLGNDIKVYVMDESNYVAWGLRGGIVTCYESGQVAAGSFDVTLPNAGTYRLIYDNTFSLLSPKRVATHAVLVQ